MSADDLTTSKAFETLQARAALAGVEVVRTDARDGAPRVLIQRRGAWRELRNVDDVESLVTETFANGRAAR